MKKIWTPQRRECPVCGAICTVTYEEPLHDSSGANTRVIDTTGCWAISSSGKLEKPCEKTNR